MKTAQELRTGNVVLVNSAPFVVQKIEYHRSGRNASVVKAKFKNLMTGACSESVHRADDKFELVILDRRACVYSYFMAPMYVFMDEHFNQYEIEKDNMGIALDFLEDHMECELVFYDHRAISIEMPPIIVREIEYTEPTVRGDTTGKMMKPARLKTGFELAVATFCEIGDYIEVDTRTCEFRRRLTS